MSRAPWNIVLFLACSRLSAADTPVQPNFDAGKFAGKWYPIQLVSDTVPAMRADIAGKTAVPLPNGDMEVNVENFANGKCGVTTTTFSHTDQPGKFKNKVGDTVSIVETDYETYHACHVETVLGNFLHLDAREPEVSDDIKETFKKLATSLGFSVDKIVDTPRTDACQ